MLAFQLGILLIQNPQDKSSTSNWFSTGNDVEDELYWLNALLEHDITGDSNFRYDYGNVDGPNLSSNLTIDSNYNWEYGVFKFGTWFIAIENDSDAEINFAGINFNNMDGFIGGESINGLSHYTLFNTTPVPEPATMFLLGAGLVGITGIRRKLKK
ncbi:MAG: PEP-CTERM sorting domain-containing protein [Desulfobacteraceae bacterium]